MDIINAIISWLIAILFCVLGLFGVHAGAGGTPTLPPAPGLPISITTSSAEDSFIKVDVLKVTPSTDAKEGWLVVAVQFKHPNIKALSIDGVTSEGLCTSSCPNNGTNAGFFVTDQAGNYISNPFIRQVPISWNESGSFTYRITVTIVYHNAESNTDETNGGLVVTVPVVIKN